MELDAVWCSSRCDDRSAWLLLCESEAAARWEVAIQRLTAAARKHLFDTAQSVFVSVAARQIIRLAAAGPAAALPVAEHRGRGR